MNRRCVAASRQSAAHFVGRTAALCRDAATPMFMVPMRAKSSGVRAFHEPAFRSANWCSPQISAALARVRYAAEAIHEPRFYWEDAVPCVLASWLKMGRGEQSRLTLRREPCAALGGASALPRKIFANMTDFDMCIQRAV